MIPRLLLVDDDAAIRFAVERYFLTRGYEIDTAPDRELAETMFDRTRYDLLIADLRLSGLYSIEGLELVTHVRARSPRIRTILLTAYASPGIDEEARRRGADRVLQKPRRLSELAEIVADLLRERR